MWLLLIEDEARLASALKEGLEEDGYTVDVAQDGIEGETLALANAYDALIVDWRLRAAGRHVPIIMLTALTDVDHRVAGLDAGADDYLSKPFKFEELLARLRALLRRQPIAEQGQIVRMAALVLDTKRRMATIGDNRLDLRPKEYALLEDLMRHKDEVLSRSVIAERVWGQPFFITDNVIDVTVSSLRQKLKAAQSPSSIETSVQIETIRGVGYRIVSG